jgi:hypothetical protein
MSEATPAVAAPAAPAMAPITSSQAATMLAERRAASAPTTNPSDAARILGQRAAEARKERQAQAAQPQEAPAVVAEAGSEPEDESTPIQGSDTPGDETATHGQPSETQATEGEPEGNEPQTIELEPGLKVTLDEVRAGFMLKADHTRKTQALAEERKQLEGNVSQKLSLLERQIAALEPLVGNNKPKTMRDFVHEHGAEEGLVLFHEHQARVEAARRLAEHTRTTAQKEARAKAEQDCDQHLVEHYSKEWADPQKYDAAMVEITKHAKAIGLTNDEIYAIGTNPAAIIALDESRQFRALKASTGSVKASVAEKPKVIRPGAKLSAQAGAHSAANSAKAQLKSSGSLADAVKYLQARRGAPRS